VFEVCQYVTNNDKVYVVMNLMNVKYVQASTKDNYMDEKIRKRKQKSRTQLEQKKHGNSNVMKTQLIFLKFKTRRYNRIHQSW
jgi:hypothetical protein